MRIEDKTLKKVLLVCNGLKLYVTNLYTPDRMSVIVSNRFNLPFKLNRRKDLKEKYVETTN